MSKPVAKIAFALLITVILVAGIYTSVQGAWLNAGTKSGQVHVDAGLNADLSHQRSSGQGLQTFWPQDGGHGCHSDSQADPND